MSESWAGRHVVVVGAGRSGAGAGELLLALGARVVLTDTRPASAIPGLDELADAGARLELGGHPEALWSWADAVVASPGIPATAPPLQAATAHGLPILSEVELAGRHADAPCVAITGSNGKSTVTAMVSAILERAGMSAPACGNIGVPFAGVVARALRGEQHPDRYVVELSSFQTETLQSFQPHWTAVLNISADHLDRHRNFEHYAAAKMRIAHAAGANDWFVYGADDPWVAAHVPEGPAAVPFGVTPPATGAAAWIADGHLHWRDPERVHHDVMPLARLRVVGTHNAVNAAAATALACLAGAAPADAAAALAEFTGLEHRMEPCGSVAGVRCINDSKATNVGATIAALQGLEAPLWLILGGRDKDSDFTTLRPWLGENVRGVLLIGEATDRIASALNGMVPVTRCRDLESAVDTALAQAADGDQLVLAPACASFDQYDNFAARGQHFRDLIEARAQESVDSSTD